MPYQGFLDIEQRFSTALRLIPTGRYSTLLLAKRLRISIPTVSRGVQALRERACGIRAEKQGTRVSADKQSKAFKTINCAPPGTFCGRACWAGR
jgi:hypothetical protein